MNLLAIYLKFFLLLHRKNISLSQAISIHGFHQPLDFPLASFLVIHHYRYLISLHDSHALSNNKVALLLICMIKNIISAAFQLDEYDVFQLHSHIVGGIKANATHDGIVDEVNLLRVQHLHLYRWRILHELEYHIGLLDVLQIIFDGFGMTNAHYLTQ